MIATAGNQSALVGWTPGSDGGNPVQFYTVTPFIGTAAQTPTTVQACSACATQVTVTGLTNGVSYTFAVSATNGVGTGPTNSLPSNAVTPSGPPAGNPNNAPGNPVGLGHLDCGQTVSTSGTSANDGSNAWYAVSFTGQANALSTPCNLKITLSAHGPTTVFDISRGGPGAPDAAGVTMFTEMNPGIDINGIGINQTYFIHVYDPAAGAVITNPFTLTLQA